MVIAMSDWKNNLNSFFEKADEMVEKEKKTELEQFILDVATPALEDVAMELQAHGRICTVRASSSTVAIMVNYNGEEELSYRIQSRTFPTGVLPVAEIRYRQRGGRKLVTTESMFRGGRHDFRIPDMVIEEVIEHFIQNYTSRVKPA